MCENSSERLTEFWGDTLSVDDGIVIYVERVWPAIMVLDAAPPF